MTFEELKEFHDNVLAKEKWEVPTVRLLILLLELKRGKKMGMTNREKTLDWLYRLRSKIYVYMPKEWLIPMSNALDVAIKVLEQEPKIGHWITKPHVYGVTYCSECNFELKIDNTNYCPNCGAKMVESQGSEVKE